jgi:regulator of chromosome condensation
MNYLNPLPVAPQHQRPSLQLFVWGATDFGQCGLGAETRGEISKPKRSTWAESKMGEGAFGGAGAGLESIASGGMHSLFVDETGKVRGIQIINLRIRFLEYY